MYPTYTFDAPLQLPAPLSPPLSPVPVRFSFSPAGEFGRDGASTAQLIYPRILGLSPLGRTEGEGDAAEPGDAPASLSRGASTPG